MAEPYTAPPAVLLTLVTPTSTFDQRKQAILDLARDSWAAGWDACEEEVLGFLATFGAMKPEELRKVLKDARGLRR
jgi:hypothetical protein